MYICCICISSVSVRVLCVQDGAANHKLPGTTSTISYYKDKGKDSLVT